MKYNCQRISHTIGDTPLIEIEDGMAVKAEMYNPSGSVKDRVAQAAVDEALTRDKDGIVEPTSGNTGIGIAMISASYNLPAILTVPEDHSTKKIKKMEAYGAEAVVSENHRQRAKEISEEKDYFLFNQYENRLVTQTHQYWTGEEIVDDVEDITHFVASMTTGGTITGISRRLHRHDEDIKVIGLDSETSNLKQIFEGKDFSPRHSNIDGVGKHYKSGVLDFEHIDEVIEVSKQEAKEGARELARSYGILAGYSSGAVFNTMKSIEGESVVGLLPDSGNRYKELHD